MVASAGSINGSVGFAPYLGAFTYNLSALVNSQEFTNLFDQYRITFIVARWWLSVDPSAQTAAAAVYPKLYWYRDYDDSTIPGSLNEMRENGRTKVVNMHPSRPITIAFKPNTLLNVWNTGFTTATQSPAWKQWIDCTNPNTTHYGYKMAIDNFTNTNYTLTSEVTYYFQCKSVR